MFDQFIQAIVDAINSMGMSFRSKFMPAEPYDHVFNATIPAVIGSILNNQALDLRLDYDVYAYAIGIVADGVFDFQIKQAGGGVLYSNAQIRSTAITSALVPAAEYYRPWKIPAATDLTIDLTNRIAGANVVQIVLRCWKGRPQGGTQ